MVTLCKIMVLSGERNHMTVMTHTSHLTGMDTYTSRPNLLHSILIKRTAQEWRTELSLANITVLKVPSYEGRYNIANV